MFKASWMMQICCIIWALSIYEYAWTEYMCYYWNKTHAGWSLMKAATAWHYPRHLGWQWLLAIPQNILSSLTGKNPWRWAAWRECQKTLQGRVRVKMINSGYCARIGVGGKGGFGTSNWIWRAGPRNSRSAFNSTCPSNVSITRVRPSLIFTLSNVAPLPCPTQWQFENANRKGPFETWQWLINTKRMFPRSLGEIWQ